MSDPLARDSAASEGTATGEKSERSILVVSAGLSEPSSTRMLADRLSSATAEALTEHGLTAHTRVVELRTVAHDITDNLLTGFAPPALGGVIDAVLSSDALIAVTPIFSASYSGLFKSFLDVLDPEALEGKPVLLGATAGTPRHSLALDFAIRPLFSYLRAAPVATGVFAASTDWGTGGGESDPLVMRVRRAARELANAVAARPIAPAVDPLDPETYLGAGGSFAQLLGGAGASGRR